MSPRAVERGEGGVGIVAIGRIQGIIGMVLVGGIEGIIRRKGLRRIQRIVRRIFTGRIEDIVVALVLLREALLSKGGSDNKEAGRQNQAGSPPMSRCRS